jgi:hypothetical protein
MATGLQNQPNTSPVTADYPNKNIQDNSGLGDGTPFDKQVYADFHQFFAKLMRLTGIVPNVLPENESNGFQYIQALLGMNADFGELIAFDRSGSLFGVSGSKSPLLYATGGAPDVGDIALEDSTVASERNLEVITVLNNSTNVLNIFPGGLDTINGLASLAIASGATRRLVLHKTNANWIVIQ